MTVLTCALCGSPARQTYAILTFADHCDRLPTGVECTNEKCRADQAAETAADRAAANERAIADAIARGVIDP